MKTICFYFAFCSIMTSCLQKKHEVIIQNLTNNEIKCWYHYYNDTSKPYFIGFCFSIDGTYKDYDRKKHIFLTEHTPLDPTPLWKLLNDSTLMFGDGFYYKIIYLNNDSIVLENVAIKGSYIRLHRDTSHVY
ncbi:hypothetical protein [Parasediminibacterium sp. JCM 36343]|uniref:hypothetical protein n=1 Tax=Parasediminibacterium sp. JCM 36343 TaxID=3374279 RepID=UPI00397D142C